MTSELVSLPADTPIWQRVFTVAPLVLVSTREGDGYDIAPKHLAMPFGWADRYSFICTPRHATYRNAVRDGVFTVTFPRPEQVLGATMAASGRDEDGAKRGLAALEVFPARAVDGVLVAGGYLFLECELDVVHGDGDARLVVGRIVAAHVAEDAQRAAEVDDADLVYSAPLLAYLSPGRFAPVAESYSFPFPADFTV